MADTTKKSYSPTALAFRRLRKNRLAMAGAILLAGMTLFVCFGDHLVDTTESENRLWVARKAPGFTHPHCPEEILFVKAKRPQVSPRILEAGRVTYMITNRTRREIRVTLRRGKISRIAEGAQSMDTLDLSTVGSSVFEIMADKSEGRSLPPILLKTGAKPPGGLLKNKQRVIMIGWNEIASPLKATISIADTRVSAIDITKDGVTTPASFLTVYGKDIKEVLLNDRPLLLCHPLGTDQLGRDLLLRVVTGGRISLMVGLVATLVSIIIGVSYGAIAGFLGGRIDSLMMRIVDIIYGLPFIFLVLLLMVLFNSNIILLFVALGMVQWLTMARIVRGQVLSLREMDFVDAARMSGASTSKIIFSHLIPHTAGPVMVYATLTVPVVILEESFLAFIGLPVQYQGTTMESWGSLVHKGMSELGDSGQNWWLLVFPSLAMVLTLFALNCLGDGLRDSFDPKHK